MGTGIVACVHIYILALNMRIMCFPDDQSAVITCHWKDAL